MTTIATKYDFDALQAKFTSMTNEEIMQEYVSVLKQIDLLSSGNKDLFFEFIDELQMAEDYLGGYLARLICYQNGFLEEGI